MTITTTANNGKQIGPVNFFIFIIIWHLIKASHKNSSNAPLNPFWRVRVCVWCEVEATDNRHGSTLCCLRRRYYAIKINRNYVSTINRSSVIHKTINALVSLSRLSLHPSPFRTHINSINHTRAVELFRPFFVSGSGASVWHASFDTRKHCRR